ncbi:M56 family metallopeptidase [Roseisolibacter agri]|uniref:Peptidase M56 domain-containing protein n=1 Tax=Roseisolibacter agri TaxID=2014610 RepID=A0AA37QFT5_9BACT|nr:M56 family metallopeptidase [Roseisolibacter agri]GLC25620.1 hypothetical protein rosag_21330 [Roseisolibacter agri]
MSDLVASLGGLAADWLPALVDVTLKGTVILGVAGLATTWGMRRAAAATRHLVWSAAVVAVLALPVLTALVPRWSAPVVPAALARAAAALREPPAAATPVATTPDVAQRFRVERAPDAPALTQRDYEAGVAAGIATVPPTPAGAEPSRVTVGPNALTVQVPRTPDATPTGNAGSAPTWLLALFGVWAAGVLFVLLRLALGTAGLARLVRRAQPADDPAWVMPLQRLARELGIRRPVSLYVGRTGTVPVTWGVVYPVVLLPADAAEWTEDRRRAVLLHELAHVERLDALTQVLAQLATAIFWFNPLVTLAGRRLRAERERACDDLVLAAGGVPATRYADDLLDLVRTLGEASPAAAALAMARRSEFEGRLLAILDPAAPRARTDRRRALAAAALVALAAVPLAGLRASVAAPAARMETAEEMAAARPAAPSPARATPVEPQTSTTVPTVAMPPVPMPTVAMAPEAPRMPELRSSLATVGAGLGAVAERMASMTPHLTGITPVADACRPAYRRAGVAQVYQSASDTSCLEVRTYGTVEFTPDYADVRVISEGGVLRVAETRDGITRIMEVTPRDGRLVRRYTVGGDERPTAEGEAWFRGILTNVVRRSRTFASTARATTSNTRLVRAGDLPAVLAEVRRVTSDGDKRRLLESLLAARALTASELEQVTLAARGIVSDGDKSSVLRAVAAQQARTPAVSAAIVGASRGITSDGDRRRVLERTLGPDLTPAVIADLVRAVAGMTSDGDKSAVLQKLARRVGETGEIRTAFFRTLDGFTSDGERRRVLIAALDSAGDDATVAATLDQTHRMTSDGERVEVLRAVARKRRMEVVPVRERFFAAVNGMVSETARETVLLAALRAQPTCVDTQKGAIAATRNMVSDTKRANVLLEVAKSTPALREPATRAQFLDALKTMTSSSEYRRVMDAVVP